MVLLSSNLFDGLYRMQQNEKSSNNKIKQRQTERNKSSHAVCSGSKKPPTEKQNKQTEMIVCHHLSKTTRKQRNKTILSSACHSTKKNKKNKQLAMPNKAQKTMADAYHHSSVDVILARLWEGERSSCLCHFIVPIL